MIHHTQGPWFYNGDEGSDTFHHGHNISIADKVIATVGADNSDDDDQQAADARLIAAAPELLAAATDAANLLADFDESLEHEGGVYRALVAAINKAKGA